MRHSLLHSPIAPTRIIAALLPLVMLLPLIAAAQADHIGLRVIVVTTEEEAGALLRRLEAGEAFADLAAAHSIAPSRASGGFLGTVSPGDLSPEFQSASRGLGPGEISAITPTGGDYALLQVLDARDSDWIGAMDLGMRFLSSGRLDQAERSFTEAREDALAFGQNDYRVGVALASLGDVSRARQDYREAEDFYRGALENARSGAGPDHPQVATALGTLGRLAIDEGRLDRAEDYFQQALEILVGGLGPNHPEVALAYRDLAGLRREQGNLQRAEALYRTALAILEQALGPDHPEVGGTLESLAAVVSGLGRDPEAGRLRARAQSIQAAPGTP